MKKIIFSVVLFMTLLLSNTSHAQTWTAYNTGFPLNSYGFKDKINGIATIQYSPTGSLAIAATNTKGVQMLSINSASGIPTGAWSLVPGCPYPNNRVSSIVSSGNILYVCFNDVLEGVFEVPKIYKCAFSTSGMPSWTLLNNASLPSKSLYNGNSYLALYKSSHLFYTDNLGSGPYRLTTSGTTWTTFTPSSSSAILPSNASCMIVNNSGYGHIGTNAGIYSFQISGTTITFTNVYSSASYPACVNMIPYTGPTPTPGNRTKTFYAIVSSFCPSPHSCVSNIIRYERGSSSAGPDVVYNIGGTTSTSELLEIPDPKIGSYGVGKLICTQSNAFSGPTYLLGKSIDDGNSWLSASVTGLPSPQYISCLQNFGTITSGATYLGTGEVAGPPTLASNLGFYYYTPVSMLKQTINTSEFIDNRISISPNPTSATFSLTGNNEDNYEITIVDLQGKTLYTGRGLIADINNNLPNISTWTNGIYIVRINNTITQETSVEKLVKQ